MGTLTVTEKAVLFVLALMLPAYGLATMPLDGVIEATAMRNLGLPILIAEMMLCLLAVARGVTLSTIWRQTSSIARWGAGLWLVAAVCSTFVLEPVDGSGSGLFMMSVGHLLFAALCAAAIRTRWNSIRSYLLPSLAAGIAGYTILAVIFSFYAARIPGFDWISFGFGAGNVRHLGYYAVVLTGLSLGMLSGMRGKWDVPAIGLLFLGTFLLFWSGGRGPILCLLGQITVAAACSDSSLRLRIVSTAALVSLASVVMAHWLAPDPTWGPGGLLTETIETKDLNDFSSSRLAIWVETLKAVADQPLMGYGPGQFKSIITSSGGVLAQPHNIALQLLFHWGLVGSLCLVLVMIGALHNTSIHALRDSPPELSAALVLVGLGALSLVDGALFYPFPVIAAILSISILSSWAPDNNQARKNFFD